MPGQGLLRGGARAELAGDTRTVKRAQTHMANNPKKVKDPTEVALSAIQEALNISDTNAETGRGQARSEVAPPVPPAQPAFNEPTFDNRPIGADRPMFEEEPRAPRRPANDDRETIGRLLQAIQKGRP